MALEARLAASTHVCTVADVEARAHAGNDVQDAHSVAMLAACTCCTSWRVFAPACVQAFTGTGTEVLCVLGAGLVCMCDTQDAECPIPSSHSSPHSSYATHRCVRTPAQQPLRARPPTSAAAWGLGAPIWVGVPALQLLIISVLQGLLAAPPAGARRSLQAQASTCMVYTIFSRAACGCEGRRLCTYMGQVAICTWHGLRAWSVRRCGAKATCLSRVQQGLQALHGPAASRI